MAEMISPMEIDGHDRSYSAKGKGLFVAGNTPIGRKAIPWVEKYRPQSLDDVAAHRDIVDTSNVLFPFHLQGLSFLQFFRKPLHNNAAQSENRYNYNTNYFPSFHEIFPSYRRSRVSGVWQWWNYIACFIYLGASSTLELLLSFMFHF